MDMIEIRIHGRGGQGAVIASQILASAFFKEGKFSQCFSSFGGERRGAPVVSFIRVADRRIRLRCGVTSPDQVVVLDCSLMDFGGITAGLKEGGLLLINTDRGPEEVKLDGPYHIFTVDANAIARKHNLGGIVNTAMVGAYARASGLLSIDSVVEALLDAVPANPRANESAAREAFQEVKG